MPTNQPAASVSNTERDNYDKSVGRLAQASQLEKLLLWFIAVIAAIGLIVTVVGVNNQNDANKAAITRQTQELAAQKKTIDTLVTLGNQRSAQINDLQNHVDCLFKLATQPGHSNIAITDITGCQLTTSGSISTPSGTTTTPTTTQPSQSSTNLSNPSSTGTTSPATPKTTIPVAPLPKAKSVICTVTLGLLGC